MAEKTESKRKQLQKVVIIMVKKILISAMCLMLLLGVSVSAQREMPQGNPESFMGMPQGTPPGGMELPEGVEPPQGMQGNREGFSGGEQGQRPQGNTDNTQIENEQPTDETGENAQQPQEQGENQQGQNAEAMPPLNMNFGGGEMSEGFNFGGAQTEAEPMTFIGFVKEYQTPIISVVLLLFAFVFVKLYKRKNY